MLVQASDKLRFSANPGLTLTLLYIHFLLKGSLIPPSVSKEKEKKVLA